MNRSICKPYSLQAWIFAIRPKSLVAAVIPLLVGSLIGTRALMDLDWVILFHALFAAISITIATNLINDALDFKKGADTEERIGPIRVTQSGLLPFRLVLSAGILFSLIAFLFAIPIVIKGGNFFLILVSISLLCSYIYTGGPYPLAYKGLGELFVIIFYGLAATLSTYYLQMGKIGIDAFIAAFQMGFLASTLIAINNLRDKEGDSKANKLTLAVRFGLLFGKWEITFFVLAPFLLNFYWLYTGKLLAFLLPSTALLIGVNLLRGIWKYAPSRLYNRYFGDAALLLTIFGIMLILGMRIA